MVFFYVDNLMCIYVPPNNIGAKTPLVQGARCQGFMTLLVDGVALKTKRKSFSCARILSPIAGWSPTLTAAVAGIHGVQIMCSLAYKVSILTFCCKF